mmetsp:Transcript_8234/g.24724  ORF Transcript_8234/g.24724 Transcript_8234/m.24724 type:complete len:215 (-) Transcript_8234:2010-2654(-)
MRASSCAAKLAAHPNARMVVSGVTEAIATSLFETSPASLTRTLMVTMASSSSSFNSRRARASASADPCTSALMTTHISLRSFCFSPENKEPTDIIKSDWYDDPSRSRVILARLSASCLAVCSSGATTSKSPASGIPSNPTMFTGVDGPASFTLVLPSVAMRALTLPLVSPATKTSPTLMVPRWMSVVATVPNPFPRLASMTIPCASRSGLALRS